MVPEPGEAEESSRGKPLKDPQTGEHEKRQCEFTADGTGRGPTQYKTSVVVQLPSCV